MFNKFLHDSDVFFIDNNLRSSPGVIMKQLTGAFFEVTTLVKTVEYEERMIPKMN